MKRFLTSTLVLLSAIMGMQAAIVETTLWEGEKVFTDYAGLEIEKTAFATVAAGDVVTMTITACEASDAKFAFKQKDNGWAELTGFEWVDVAEPFSYEYTVDETTATELASYGLVVQGNNITVTRLTLTQAVADAEEPTQTTTLWNGTAELGDWANFEALRYDGRGSLANVKVGDAVRVTFTNAAEGCQIYVCDADSYSEFEGGYFEVTARDEAQSVDFRVGDATVLESIARKGIVVKGKLATLTKIELLTYATSYDAIAVTIGDDGLATFSSSRHHSFAQVGITPYYASAVATGSVTLTSIEDKTTWGYQGYVLKGAAGTYTIPVVASDDDATYPSGTNYLKATDDYDRDIAASTEGQHRYIFAKNGSAVGFYYLNSDYKLAARHAYLQTDSDIRPSGEADARIVMNFDGSEATTVEHISLAAQAVPATTYDLQGRRAGSQLKKGLYIQNGRKCVIK